MVFTFSITSVAVIMVVIVDLFLNCCCFDFCFISSESTVCIPVVFLSAVYELVIICSHQIPRDQEDYSFINLDHSHLGLVSDLFTFNLNADSLMFNEELKVMYGIVLISYRPYIHMYCK